jgi:hypothetical protein
VLHRTAVALFRPRSSGIACAQWCPSSPTLKIVNQLPAISLNKEGGDNDEIPSSAIDNTGERD